MPMWDVFIRRWLELVFWWLPKNRGAPSREAKNAPPQRAPTLKPAEPSARPAPASQAKRDAPSAHGASARPAAGRAAAPPATNGGAPRPPQAGVRAPKPTVTQPEKAVTPPIPDDLTVIKGIGPAVQNKLRALGITTFADLAAADPDRLLAEFKGSQPLTAARVRGWTEAARERARA
jgi:predicted flap endonuclease-1-like 5' DNA nuclease